MYLCKHMQKSSRTNIRKKHIFHFTFKQKHSSKKANNQMWNPFSVFMTNTLIIKTTKAVQSKVILSFLLLFD